MSASLLSRPRVASSLLALFLAACGGGSSTTSTSTTTPTPAPAPAPTPAPAPAPVVGALSGVFSDGPVQGVSFSTTSGVTGVTDAQGRFTYNAGDKVTFTLGAVSLGSTTASSLITPLSLAGGDSTRLQNTLVLLQSLDSDGVPDNGITIPTAAANAVGASVILTQATGTFASSANAGLSAAMTAGGISRAVTSASSATAHFVNEARKNLASGIWMTSSGTAMIRFGSDGTYIMVTREEASKCGTGNTTGPICGDKVISQSGVEYGAYLVQGIAGDGYTIKANPSLDTNLQSGLSHPASCDGGMVVDGDTLTINSTCISGSTRLVRVPNVANSIVGVWAVSSTASLKTQHFTFLPDGRYFMWDPLGDSEGNNPGIKGGIEYGTYTYNATTGALTAAVAREADDTNGGAGIAGSTLTARLSTDGSTLTVPGGTPSATPTLLYRVSR